MSQGRLHGSRASAPEPCRCVSLGNVHPPDLRSIHPALTSRSLLEDLHAGGMIREVSGRGSFRVYAVA